MAWLATKDPLFLPLIKGENVSPITKEGAEESFGREEMEEKLKEILPEAFAVVFKQDHDAGISSPQFDVYVVRLAMFGGVVDEFLNNTKEGNLQRFL